VIPPKVLAELGQTKDLSAAVSAVDACHQAGCWGVKIQMLAPDLIASGEAEKYWDHGDDRSQRDVYEQNGVLSSGDVAALARYVDSLDMGFVVTPFDVSQVVALADVPELNAIKIASGDITNIELLEAIRDFHPSTPLILSTGGATEDEIRRATTELGWTEQDILLACSLQYPTPPENANFERIASMRRRSWLTPDGIGAPKVGYSDHTESTWSAPMLVALKCVLIEKHFTMNPNVRPETNPDDHMALDPVGMAQFVSTVNGAVKAMGSHEIAPHAGEKAAVHGARRSLFASVNILAGDTLTQENTISLRPGPASIRHVPAERWHDVIDTAVATKPISAGGRITFENCDLTDSE
jgi:sialic acid synthase SpsE